MTPTSIAAVTCFIGCSLASAAIGLKYLTRADWMPYHEAASGTRWDSLGQRMQLTVRTMVRVAGAGIVTTGAATVALLVAWALTRHQAVLVLAGVPALVFAAPVLVATRRLKAATGAKTPVGPAAAVLALAAIGMLLAML